MCTPLQPHLGRPAVQWFREGECVFVAAVGWGRGAELGAPPACCRCYWQVIEERLCEHGEIMLSPPLPSLPQLRGGFGFVWINLPDSGLYLESVLCVCVSALSIVSSVNWINHSPQALIIHAAVRTALPDIWRYSLCSFFV